MIVADKTVGHCAEKFTRLTHRHHLLDPGRVSTITISLLQRRKLGKLSNWPRIIGLTSGRTATCPQEVKCVL